MGLMPPVPTPQGASSKTFVTPPIDGSITAAELFDFNAEHSPEHPFFLYQEPETKALVEIPWKRMRLATHRVAQQVQSLNVGGPRIIAILALIDTVSYFTLIHGIIRAGFVPFPLSPRNSPAAIAHLLKLTECTHMFVSEDPSMQGLSGGSLKVLAAQGGHSVERVPTPFFGELYAEPSAEEEAGIPNAKKVDLTELGLILHSSGSTSFPKPIRITNRILVQWLRIPAYGEVDLCGEVIGGVALPMFHALGVINSLSMAASGAILGVFKPVRQPPFPTPDRVIDSVTALNVSVLFALPVFLEASKAWAQNPAHVEPLKKPRAVIFSGGPLSKVVGDALAAEGVHLMQALGITEVGCANTFIPEYVNGYDWEWFQFSKQHMVHLAPQPGSEAVELQLVPCETHTPAALNVKIDGVDAYSTNDLMQPHPTKKGYFKVLGRVDDQIMLSTGEKTNPGPLEAIISKDPLVDGAVMFGRGRVQNGVIIQPAAKLGLDVTDMVKVSNYLDQIWPAIKMANDYAPAHSRLFRELIILAKPSKPFTFTGKGSIRKSAVVADYADEIELTYEAVEASTSANVDAPAVWDQGSTLNFVRAVVHKVMEAKVTDNDDIFQHGADSLQATVIRNSIANTLNEGKFDTSAISANFVYGSPSISELALTVYSIIDPSSSSSDDKVARKIAELESYVEKYSANFPVHRASAPAPTSDVIVMTGSTGALGTTMLAQLVANPAIGKIYALNRKSSGKTLKQRQVASLVDRGYDAEIASSPKVVLVETDAKLGPLGISSALYDEIRSSATAILHTAWRVDFNLSVSTFEPLFGGVRELVDLALKSPLPSPPRLLFASSLSIFGDWHSSTPAPEEPIEDAKIVIGTGYGESKWVVEKVLGIAAKTTPLRPVIVRIGQLSGGKNGSWNTAEWIPAVVRSGEVVGALPSSDAPVSWLPLQTAAASIIDFRNAQTGTVNLAHPYPASWNAVFGPIAAALGVRLVPYAEWLDLLESDLADPKKTEVEAAVANPALRLIDMFRPFRNGADPKEAREAMGVPMLQTTKAVSASSALSRANLAPLGAEDALNWLSYWQSAGLLKTKSLVVPLYVAEKPVSPDSSSSLPTFSTTPLVVGAAAVASATYLLSKLRRA